MLHISTPCLLSVYQGSERVNHIHGSKEVTSAVGGVLFDFFTDLALPHCPRQALEAALSLSPTCKERQWRCLACLTENEQTMARSRASA